ncbi:MAG TPA: hypothetical protein VM533_07600 [Fimbriiglobus sp.]|jgi:hypothetical protein|nr:hypothetical protein [Fimbriiglobus sp.]
MRIARLLLCALGSLALSARADGQALYAATASGGPGELFILNPANGAVVQDVGPLNDANGVNYGITGLAFHPITGVLYGSVANNNPATRAQLVTIDPATARVTVVGPYNAGNPGTTPTTMADLAFTASGSLFGVGSVGGPQLYSINTATGQATVVGSSGLTSTGGGGLAVSPADVFYGTPTSTRFGTYNSTTGVYTNITDPVKPAGGAYAALDFDGSGVLYGLNSGAGAPPPTHLVTFDPATGAITDLGASVNSLDAIAFRPVPEPGAVLLVLAPVVAGLLIRARCRR